MKLLLIFIPLFLFSCSKYDMRVINPGHYCEYKNCPFSQGSTTFTSGCGSCFIGDICWKLDSIHFSYPKLDYDGCDSILNK